jgi:hypothetical protein
MPDNNNRLTQQDLYRALTPAELRIAEYIPPAVLNGLRANFSVIQQQMAENSSRERSLVLFDFFQRFGQQVVTEEIARQQILQRLSNLSKRRNFRSDKKDF